MIKTVIIGLLLVLAGCSTKPVAILDYYLLDNAEPKATHSKQNIPRVTITIQDIGLADYLTQANLAIQLASHQLYYSKQHLWAEPLQKGIQKALLKDLNAATSEFAFVNTRSAMAHAPDVTIGIQVDHFVATHESMVVMAGYYWLQPNNDKQMTKQLTRFHFSKPLEQDGFPHSVSQLRVLISELSDEILSRVKALDIE
ncbi:PqiC family protein [Aliiglaciecola litoralis]|uniref:ABC-type transport auxiliary lipoprotein component domain-containing protein n=1 Tax=Aliiglaciecola litoralis TaxID=582857 RepID=A0ABP3WPM1_9ALTE